MQANTDVITNARHYLCKPSLMRAMLDPKETVAIEHEDVSIG